MIILIDAYNVLKYFYGNRVSERHKEQLITMLNQYVKRKQHTIYLVFDGGDSPRPMRYTKGAVTIIYSGYKESADQVLIELMEQPWAFDGVLVSNDRALRSYASPAQIDPIGVKLFYDIIAQRAPAQKIPPQAVLEKYSDTVSDPILDALLMADDAVVFKDEIEEDMKVKTIDTLSKEQKRYQAKLKRL